MIAVLSQPFFRSLPAGRRRLARRRFSAVAVFTILLVSAYARMAAAQAADPARQFFTDGQRELAANHLRRARRDFLAVLHLHPGLAGAEVNLGVIAERQHRWHAARARLLRARQHDPALAGIDLDLGLVEYRRGRYDRAAGYFQRFLRRAPRNGQARYLLGLCQFFRQQFTPALSTLMPLWPTQRNNFSYLYVISIAAGKAKRLNLAHRAMRRMAKIGAGTPELKLILARGYINLQQNVKAQPLLLAAEKQNPNLPFLHFCLGVIAQRQHHFKTARREFLADLKIEPDMAYDPEHLGQIALLQGQPGPAATWFQQALAQKPRLAAAQFGLGEARLRLKQYAAALRSLRRAQRLSPQSASVRIMEGRALLLSGHRRQAQLAFAAGARLRRQVQDHLRQEISGRRLPNTPPAAH